MPPRSNAAKNAWSEPAREKEVYIYTYRKSRMREQEGREDKQKYRRRNTVTGEEERGRVNRRVEEREEGVRDGGRN